MSTTNKEIVQKINDAFVAGDTKGFLAYCADDVIWNMLGDQTFKGKQVILDFIGTASGEPPRFTTRETIAEDDFVASTGEMVMKNKEGIEEEYNYCDLYRFSGGKVAELTSYVVKTSQARKV